MESLTLPVPLPLKTPPTPCPCDDCSDARDRAAEAQGTLPCGCDRASVVYACNFTEADVDAVLKTIGEVGPRGFVPASGLVAGSPEERRANLERVMFEGYMAGANALGRVLAGCLRESFQVGVLDPAMKDPLQNVLNIIRDAFNEEVSA